MMRNDEIDLSQHRSSRIPRVVMIVATLGVGLVAAWVFAPILLANYSAGTATASVSPKPRVATETAAARLASAQSAAALPTADTTAVATADDQNSPAAPAGPAVRDTTASTTLTAPPWPQDRALQAAAPAANADTMQVAAVAPADTPAEPFENVPLPRKRPSRLIAASLNIPLPRPRPDIPTDAPPVDQSTFDLQVERMR